LLPGQSITNRRIKVIEKLCAKLTICPPQNRDLKEGEDDLEINDNGTRMDKEIINNHYPKVGYFFYK